MKTLNQMIIEIMQAKDCTQTELAKQLKITPSSLSAWMNGRTIPNEENLQKIKELHTVLTR